MRTLSTILVLTCLDASAQNWALLNPTYRYNYANDGSDTISNQVFALRVDTLGVDTFLFELNPVGSYCEFCPDAPLGCYSPGLWIDRPQVFGVLASKLDNTWYLIGADSLLVLPNAGSGAQWTGPAAIQGTVSSVAEQDVLGQLDSIKMIDFSDGRSLVISKAHGIIGFSADGIDHDLIGIGGLDLGEQFPALADLYNYQPGDILQYEGSFGGTDGICYYSSEFLRKYTVLSRTDQTGRTDYSLQCVASSYGWGQPVWGGGPCYGSYSSGTDTVLLGIDHERWTTDNFLGSSWLDQFWPGAFASPGDPNIYPGEFGPEYHGTQWRAYLNDQDRYVMETDGIDPWDPWIGRAFLWCDPDSAYWWKSEDHTMARYVEGIGRTHAAYLFFEHVGEEELTAWSIGGESQGTILPDEIILSLPDGITEAWSLHPNPADQQITIAGITSQRTWSILDLTGRVLISGNLGANEDRINTAPLNEGTYLLRLDDGKTARFMIVR